MSSRSICSVLLALGAVASLPAQSITTLFTGTTSGHTSSSAIRPSTSFDLTVTNPNGIVVNSFDLNITRTGVQGEAEFWFTDLGNSYLNGLNAPPAGYWKLRATASFLSAGTNNASVATLNKPIVLRPGLYGVTIIYKNSTARYFTTGNGGQLQYSNGDVTIDLGAAQQNAWVSNANTPRITSMTMYYGLLNSDTVDFVADVESGTGPLTVNFTDLSSLTSPITSWEWDFDNDGLIDSTAQNPLHIYAACGDYTVRLRLNGSIERVWPNLIHVDPLVADFTASPSSGLPPLNGVQLTDTSTGSPAVFLWDFDNDGNPDSSQQNPTNNFGAGAYGVKLTVINGCRSASVTKRITAVTDVLGTAYNASSNVADPGSIMLFDLSVTATDSLIVSAMDANVLNILGFPSKIEVYLTEGTWVGKHQQPEAWRLVATGTGPAQGANIATPFVLDRPFVLLPGQNYGVAVRYVDCHGYYLSSANTVAVSNADMGLTFGAAVSTANGPFTSGTLNQPRGFSGMFHYVKANQWQVGVLNWYGAGCQGALGVPGLNAGANERLLVGTTANLTLDRMPVNTGALLFGFSSTSSVFGPLPFDMSVLAAPGCFLRTDLVASLTIIGANNAGTASISVPNVPGFAGIPLFLQGLALDPSANLFGIVMSDSLAGVIGIY
ncbi:MAG: PKD domain-containing protein [Planctomycetota bacterium]